MRHRVAAGIGLGPAGIVEQIGLEHLQPLTRIAPARAQPRFALRGIADRGVDAVPARQQLLDHLAADIAGAPGHQDRHCHLSAPPLFC